MGSDSDVGAGYYVVPADKNSAGSLKKKGVGSRSWILMDSSGQETVLDADKYEIMDRVQIHARDFRILDPLLSYPSAILGREGAIVLNLEFLRPGAFPSDYWSADIGFLVCFLLGQHIKAIITADAVLLRDPLEDNVIPVVEELRRRIKPINAYSSEDQADNLPDFETAEDDESPFEFRALEVALEAICSYLAARVIELETAAYPALDMLTSKINSLNLDRVRKLKSQMTRLTARVQKVRDEFEQLLDNDDDMADLYLSRKMADASSPVSYSGTASALLPSHAAGWKIYGASRASVGTVRGDENDIEELEMLLEAYFMQIDTTLSKLSTLREYTDSTEDYINIQLDSYRNQLIQLELFLSSGTVSISVLSLTIAIFGINIPFSWNTGHSYMFGWVVVFSVLFSALIFIYVISHARDKGLVES